MKVVGAGGVGTALMTFLTALGVFLIGFTTSRTSAAPSKRVRLFLKNGFPPLLVEAAIAGVAAGAGAALRFAIVFLSGMEEGESEKSEMPFLSRNNMAFRRIQPNWPAIDYAALPRDIGHSLEAAYRLNPKLNAFTSISSPQGISPLRSPHAPLTLSIIMQRSQAPLRATRGKENCRESLTLSRIFSVLDLSRPQPLLECYKVRP